jgi:predicted acylesterase/phospholipase RssA
MRHASRRRLRADLPFHRIALVLSGGGAMGAFEVGVLRALESVGLKPAILAGVSVGAVNAVLWVASDFRATMLERVWRSLRPSTIGIVWFSLLLRTGGVIVAGLALIEMLLTLASSRELSLSRLLWRHSTPDGEMTAVVFDALAWGLVVVAALAVVAMAGKADEWVAHWQVSSDPVRRHRRWGWVLLAGAVGYLVVWVMGLPWPYRFTSTILILGALAWLFSRPGREMDWIRELALRISPETEGRGLWGGAPRRTLIRRALARTDPRRLIDGETHLIVSACNLETGLMCYFVNWKPSEAFRERIQQSLGEVVEVTKVGDVIEAVVASSAIPGIFKPVRIDGRDLIDGGVFSNQPMHAALADGADALLVVLVSPGTGPAPPRREFHLFDVVGRLTELGNWRDLQTELRSLPEGWRRDPVESEPLRGPDRAAPPREPARVCVVEPDRVLPGGLYGFRRDHAMELIRRGEADAFAALDRAGWLEPPDVPALELSRPGHVEPTTAVG